MQAPLGFKSLNLRQKVKCTHHIGVCFYYLRYTKIIDELTGMKHMMKSIFDKTIYLEYPDDFYEMSEEEIKKFFDGDMIRFGARNVEKHVILSLAKSKKSFLNILATPKSVLDGAMNTLSSNLKDFNFLETFEVEMLSKKGNGIRFSYTAIDKDIKQFCEMAVIKNKSDFYFTYCLSRLEDRKENESVFRAFRDSIRLV